MTMYNMLFGMNPLADIILGALGLDRVAVGRFRDAYLADGDGGREFVVYTRNGGGNREDYEDVIRALRAHPCFLRDADDDYDCTYASFFFKVPEQFAPAFAALDVADATPAQRFEGFMNKLRAGKTDDPQVSLAIQKMTPVLEKITEALKAAKP